MSADHKLILHYIWKDTKYYWSCIPLWEKIMYVVLVLLNLYIILGVIFGWS